MKYTCLLFLLPLKIFSQDLTGLWAGSLFNDTTGANIRYELAVSENGGKIMAYSYTTFIIDNMEYTGMKAVKVVKLKDRIMVEDDELLYNNYPVAPPKGVKQVSALNFSNEGGTEVLSGKFITTKTRQYGKPVTGTVRLEKQTDLKPSHLIPQLYDLNLAKNLVFLKSKDTIALVKKAPPVIKPEVVANKPVAKAAPKPEVDLSNRKVETIQVINFTSDSLQLELYDNGYVDGDSVSIIVNGAAVLQHQRLSTQAIRQTVKTPRGVTDSVNLIMYAENLGSIAPNSGLLIIHDGEKRYEVTFSGDLTRNAAVMLKRKK